MRPLWLGWVIAVGVACAPQETQAPEAAPAVATADAGSTEAPAANADAPGVAPGEDAPAANAPATDASLADGGAPAPATIPEVPPPGTVSPAPKPTTSPKPPPPVRAPPPRPPSGPRPVAAPLPAGIRECTTAADCTVHCASSPGCCPEDPCGCRNAIRKDARATYDAWFASTCTPGPACPAVGCAREDAMGATCRDGRCVATHGPGF